MKSSAIILPYRSKINNPYLTKQKINTNGLQGSSTKIERKGNVHVKNKSIIKSKLGNDTSVSHCEQVSLISQSSKNCKTRLPSGVKQNKDSNQVALKKYKSTTKTSKIQKPSMVKMKKIKSLRDRLKKDLDVLRKKENDRKRMKLEIEKKKNDLMIKRKTQISSNNSIVIDSKKEGVSNVIKNQALKPQSLTSAKKLGTVAKSPSLASTNGAKSNNEKTKIVFDTMLKNDNATFCEKTQTNDELKLNSNDQFSAVPDKSNSLDKVNANEVGSNQEKQTKNPLPVLPQIKNKNKMSERNTRAELESISSANKKDEGSLKNSYSPRHHPKSVFEASEKKQFSNDVKYHHSHENSNPSHLIEQESLCKQIRSFHPKTLEQPRYAQNEIGISSAHDIVSIEPKASMLKNDSSSIHVDRNVSVSKPSHATNFFQSAVNVDKSNIFEEGKENNIRTIGSDPNKTTMNNSINISTSKQSGITYHEDPCIHLQRSNRQNFIRSPFQGDYKNEAINYNIKTQESTNTTSNNPLCEVKDHESMITSSTEATLRNYNNQRRVKSKNNTCNETNIGAISENSKEKSEPMKSLPPLSFDEERKRAARAYALGLQPNNSITKTIQRTTNYTDSAINTHHPLHLAMNVPRTNVQPSPILFHNERMPGGHNQHNSCNNFTTNFAGIMNKGADAKSYAIGINEPQIPIQNSPTHFIHQTSNIYHHNQNYSLNHLPFKYQHATYHAFPQSLLGPFQQMLPTYPLHSFYHQNMQQFSRYFIPQKLKSPNVVPSSEPFKPKLDLALTPLEPPSPWTKTHEYFKTKIVLKKARGGSFGFTVQYKTRTALVARIDVKNEVRNDETCESTTVKKKKPRRKKKSFGVVQITKTGEQIIYDETGDTNSVVKVDDIILSINDIDIGGKEFSDVVNMFSSDSRIDKDEKSVICEIKVARIKLKRKTMLKKDKGIQGNAKNNSEKQSLSSIPFVLHPNGGSVVSGDFSKEEMNVFIHGMQLANIMQLVQEYNYIHEEIWDIVHSLPNNKLVLAKRSVSDLKKKWEFETKVLEQRSQNRAITFWKQSWIDKGPKFHEMEAFQKDSKPQLNMKFMSDAKRSKLLALPRPLRGCKCGKLDHDRVNHPNCIIYRNLKQRYGIQMEEDLAMMNNTTSKSQDQMSNQNGKRCNAIQKIQNQRTKKIKLEYEADQKEALFVESMEKVILQKKQAIFAPTHLTIMVISAVSVLNACVEDSKIQKNETDIMLNRVENKKERKQDAIDDEIIDDESDSDEDDDVLLVSLKSRETMKEKEDIKTLMKIFEVYHDNETEGEKKHTVTISEILLYLSQTWGHVFIEPSHLDYAW